MQIPSDGKEGLKKTQNQSLHSKNLKKIKMTNQIQLSCNFQLCLHYTFPVISLTNFSSNLLCLRRLQIPNYFGEYSG